MTELLRGSEDFRRAAEHVDLVYTNVVEGTPVGEVRYFMRIDLGEAEFSLGDPEDAHVKATMDHTTAAELARGELTLQNAFMTGRVHVTGDLDRLLANQAALAALDSLRDRVHVAYP